MVVELINDNEVLLRNFLGIIWDQWDGVYLLSKNANSIFKK